MATSWSRSEVDLTVADYLHMLTLQLAGQSYNKTQHRRVLQQRLNGRSDTAIERKHQNISAILLDLKCPWIPGYKPLGNYQQLLYDVVEDQVRTNPIFDKVTLEAVERLATAPLITEIDGLVVAPPEVREALKQAPAKYQLRRVGGRRDYLLRVAQNASLGLAGEELVVEFERTRLILNGRSRLSERVEHVSQTKGDGLGFDVLSFEETGQERFIEVKTTSFAKETPFYVSRNEIEFSKEFASQFRLYRLFQFRSDPHMFQLSGAVGDNCLLKPCMFIATFG
jgi:hypothetical protein